jgi:arylsulfatase A-like enzyme
MKTLIRSAFCVTLLAAAGGCGGRETAVDRPNVLVVTFDTTRADHLGCYGHDTDTSPHLDALAAEAVRFDFAISTSGLTPMSHASIFTGLNPHRHGIRVFYGPTGHNLREDRPTLAELLAGAGWKTAAFVSAYTASQRYGLHRGFELFNTGLDRHLERMDLTRQQRHQHFWHDGPSTNTQRRGDATTDAVLDWLERVEDTFFLWVHYFDPHDPSLVPPPDFLDPFGITPGKDAETRIALYDPEILYMDFQFGRILARLRERGWYDDTLIVVMADHGQGLMQHGWLRHRLLYQEDIRIPLLFRVPGLDGGRVVDALVRSVDVFPTLLDLLDVEVPPGLDGMSLRAMLEGETESRPRIGYAEALNTLDTHCPKALPEQQHDLLFAILDRDWKLIFHKEHPENSELYHLATDPAELQNVFAAHPEERERLMALLEASGGLEIDIDTRVAPQDPEMLEKLRSLGYVQ